MAWQRRILFRKCGALHQTQNFSAVAMNLTDIHQLTHDLLHAKHRISRLGNLDRNLLSREWSPARCQRLLTKCAQAPRRCEGTIVTAPVHMVPVENHLQSSSTVPSASKSLSVLWRRSPLNNELEPGHSEQRSRPSQGRVARTSVSRFRVDRALRRCFLVARGQCCREKEARVPEV